MIACGIQADLGGCHTELLSLGSINSDVKAYFFGEELPPKTPDILFGKRTEKGHLMQWQKGLQRSLSSDCCWVFEDHSVILLSSHKSESGQMSNAIASMTTDKRIARNFTPQI